jgi:AAA domain
MSDKIEKASAGATAEASPRTLSERQKNDESHHITSIEDGKAFWEKYLQVLPPEMRSQYERFNLNMLTNAIGADHAALGIDALLPTLNTIPAGQILQTDYPEMTSLVESFLTSGAWFLYGKPKVGKSWLAGQLGVAVSTGRKIFEKVVKRGRVLYLALEDGERRLKKRMRLQQWPSDVDIDFMLPKDFRDQIGPLNLGGGKRLLAYIERQNYLLTIIDTFSRAINVNQLKGELMTDALSPFQEFAQAKDRTIMFIDHEPKRNDENESAITSLYGGIAKVGVADGVWRLYKERGKGVKIDIEGRDLEDAYSLKLRFDKGLCQWYSEGDAEKIEITERRQQILNALANLGRCNLSQLEDATAQAKGNLHTRLQDLVTEGIVKRENVKGSVYYSLVE